jgi:hypothetical protein
MGWALAMFFSSSTCQASKNNFLSKSKHKHKHKHQAHLLLKLRGLFIGSTQVLEALGIPEKSLLSLLVQVED